MRPLGRPARERREARAAPRSRRRRRARGRAARAGVDRRRGRRARSLPGGPRVTVGRLRAFVERLEAAARPLRPSRYPRGTGRCRNQPMCARECRNRIPACEQGLWLSAPPPNTFPDCHGKEGVREVGQGRGRTPAAALTAQPRRGHCRGPTQTDAASRFLRSYPTRDDSRGPGPGGEPLQGRWRLLGTHRRGSDLTGEPRLG